MDGEKPLVCVVYLGGSLVSDKDGSLSYTGGEAHLTDVDRETTFERFKSEIAEMHGGDISGLAFKYALPSNKRTLITISNDKDLKRMVDINRDNSSPEIYVLAKGSGPLVPVNETKNIPSRTSTNSIIESSTPIACNGDRLNKLSVLWENSITGVGQLFKDALEFREALRKYAIAKNFGYKFVQNDRRRVTAKCKGEGCSWRIHGSRVSTTKIIKIRVFKDVHTCERNVETQSHPHVTRFWIANVIKKKVQEDPDYKVSDIVKDIYQDYGLKLNYSQAWRGKETAREQLLGKDIDFYKQLPRYCEKLIDTNPGSIATLATTAEERFHRLFVSFHACISGFEHGCRPLIFLDGTILKSKYGGTLFVAASVDANDDIFPVAFAVVGQEDYDNWHWFLLQLKSALSTSRLLTFVSDRHKGLQEAVPEVFENCDHAFCLRYLTRNLKKEMMAAYSKEVKDVLVELIFGAARASRTDEFHACLESIRSVSPEAAAWIMGVDPSRWANLYFRGSRYNQMATNVIEFIDSWISKACDFPVLKLVEVMRCEITELFRTRLENSTKWNTSLTPKAEEKLHKEMDRAPLLSVSVSSATVFEVIDDHINKVDLERWECSCLNWKLMGLPCRHAIAALNCIGQSAYEFCERYFTSDCYRLTYSETINPVLDIDSISSTTNMEMVVDSYPNVELPKTRRLRGRPRKRRLESQEIEKRTLLCSKCKGPGHNKTTCKAYALTTT
ncbi:hypothetical protein EJ110_NYTH30156 [Nymphaea thermarum]|nr:hypothetical protein EJ110_NYTH30156 [Nymphaea thermarum]